ncbi:MAG: hypothetical protein IPN75_15460 [Dechloromonas sp.]|uniref:Uncharacterized protein n=1 Tax=Candidatus Dechloromonas phosphorivorans TaxID=2899244 RepID=A0A9D7QIR3_9RHOO|nr:hypothetical protein [Candidatus Dechloromonas phosphorivorans]
MRQPPTKAQPRHPATRFTRPRRSLCQAWNLKRIIAGGHACQLRPAYSKLTPGDYAKRVIWGELYDPALRFQLDEGFDFCCILPGYLPTNSEESLGNASLIVWLNRGV